MIERISGKLVAKEIGHIVVDCGGLGYGIDVPLPLFYEAGPLGSSAELHIHTYVREDQLRLFGFQSLGQLRAFKVLIGISGVGPKVALAILSTLSIGLIKEAVEENQPRVFEQVPGIGKRTAEKILVELKGKLAKLPSASGEEPSEITGATVASQELEGMRSDLLSALVNLGYKEKQVQSIVSSVLSENPEAEFAEVVRLALAKLQSGAGQASGATKKTAKQLNTLF